MSSSSRSPSAPLVVGAGEMGEAYVVALRALGVEPAVVGRSHERAEALGRRLGVRAAGGGVETLADTPEIAIVAVPPAELAGVATELLARGCRHLLVEKPGALRSGEIEDLRRRSDESGTRVAVGFNRRFYPSVTAARRLIADDGGPLSLHLELTEIEHLVTAGRAVGDPELERWGVVNSSHVLDLGFHLAGRPRDWVQRRSGVLPWHPSGAVFAGSGVTEEDVLFSYVGTWSGAGRWAVEVSTAERKLILRPLEALQVQRKGRFDVEQVAIEAEPDGVKPGLCGQLSAFLAWAAGESPDERLCTLEEALATCLAAEAVFGYS